MTTISDMIRFMRCLKCGYVGRDFIYKLAEEDVYMMGGNGKSQKIADKGEAFQYHCPRCNNPGVSICFK